MHLEITGPQAGYAVFWDISVDQTKPTHVLAATPSGEADQAIDVAGLRMMGSLRTGGVNVRSYLTTFRLDHAPGAPQTFSVRVQTQPRTAVFDRDGCQEFQPINNEPVRFE